MNWRRDFNWAGTIELNRVALNRIIAALFVMLGLDGTETVSRIAPKLHRAVLRVLYPAESAVRRLIVMAARGVVVKPVASRPMPKGHKIIKGNGSRLPAFRLFDPRKNFSVRRRGKAPRNPPRIHFFNSDWEVTTWQARPPAAAPAPPPDGLVNAARLTRRLQALKLALDNLPRQAKRLVRATARREKVPHLRFQSPLRPGRAPGHRRKPIQEVDEVLTECHGLAWEALKPDTS